jgi:rhombotail lipoprotein
MYRTSCDTGCHWGDPNSSSLVEFLYPNGKTPPPQDTLPELHIPLRVGLAYLRPTLFKSPGLDAAHREELLERIRSHLSDRKFVSEIVVLSDSYLNASRGFEGLEGAQQQYRIDLVALVSYDQFTHNDGHNWSVEYHTVSGAYPLKGDGDEVVTLVDLAVVDAASRRLVLRSGGVDVRHGNSRSRELATAAFSAATDYMIGNLDAALSRFEADMRAGKAATAATIRLSVDTERDDYFDAVGEGVHDVAASRRSISAADHARRTEHVQVAPPGAFQ